MLNSSIETKNHIKQLIENGIKDKTVGRLYEKTPTNIATSVK